MKRFNKTEKVILALKLLRLGCVPITMLMYYAGTEAWDSSIGFLLAVVFGFVYYRIVSSGIIYVVGMELKSWVKMLVEKVTKQPAYVELVRNYGTGNLLVFFQGVDDRVASMVTDRIVKKRQSEKRFSCIRTISLARVPSLDRETIEKFKEIMKVNILKAELERRGRE